MFKNYYKVYSILLYFRHTQAVTLVKYIKDNFISASDDFFLCLWNQKYENIQTVEFSHNT